MKVSQGLVGEIVSIQLARPVYMTDYKAHIKTRDGRERMMGSPIMTETGKGPGPVVMDILLGCDVLEVTEDSVRVAIITDNNIIQKTIPSALIACIDRVVAFESDELPAVTERQRAVAQPTGPGKIIL